jgi:LAS superfamily LD-carboxypeptidase LdcB
MIVKGYRKGQPFDLDVEVIDEHGHMLEAGAALSFREMRDAAARDGIKLIVNTAWRDMAYQTKLWLAYRGAMTNWEAGGRLGPRPPPVAQPGFSTHQLGLSVDINRALGDDPKTPEADSPIDKWLHANARNFLFVNDVPIESWHWTYVGR